MKKHPNKHIQEAIEYALNNGWEWVEAGKSSHAFCRLRCGNPEGEHKTHQRSVWSTPRVPENHAQQIRRSVDECLNINKCSDC
ncbi:MULTISPECIES: hypothetical protein [Yersiniaceae]|uniref:hypothetical protein n=1 Tax=Yersiniaceae TaxID=1903411 RepID=UPI00090793DB|nr:MULTISPECIES: hypothetical protein [Yersiniaceae]AUQ41253.1 hypothetical protein NJ56_04520 [Yersinia ruckeri]MCW6527999.1 hypothetical protein [Yersinia ruckeri]MCW6563171.1 hypothetical protein [Yersinia ruckeri]UIM97010.1 hypothetical protein LGL89_13595 [Yersinia ruckeri]UZY05111.1 hypothetical protein LNQ41_001430 [Yersinia ruckeri]